MECEFRLPSPPYGDPPASPIYDALTTNLPHPVMAFQSHWFPPSTPLFPHASAVLTYLNSYTIKFDLLKHICFNTRVDEAVWDGHSWNIRLSDRTTRRFDKVVVANGHYGAPRYPTIPGLQDWLDARRASHSVFYRNAQPYVGMTVLVIGNGPSGQDISAEVSTVAMTVYHSVGGSPSEDVGNVRRRGRVVRFEVGELGTVVFEDGRATDIDHVVLATGYVMSFPFLPQLRQSSMPRVPPLPSHVLNSTYNVFPLARHVFPLQDDFPADTIAFVGLLIRVAPFPVFEAQGRFIAKVFAQPSSLDRAKESSRIIARYEKIREQWGDDTTILAKEWHKFAELEQFSYRRDILDFAEVGEQWDPEEWVEEMYCAKGQLRKAWVELERNGQADKWVHGVGKGGRHEWVSMMRRLLQASKDTWAGDMSHHPV